MVHHLEESRAKIRRAKQHLNSLRLSIEAARSRKRYGIRAKFNPKSQRREVRIHLPPSLSIRWGILCGEIVHHARSSLDYAIWRGIELNGRQPLEGRAGFPVFADPSDYERGSKRPGGGRGISGVRMIKGVNAEVARVVERFQPFGPEHEADALWTLNQLWNRDKHRRLNVAVMGAGAYRAAPVARGQIEIALPPLKHGTLIFDTPLWVADMDVSEEFSGQVVFDEAGPGQGKPLLPTLAGLVAHAESIVYAIEAAL